MFLVLLAVPLAFAAGWVAGREHAQQKRDATVTAAVSPRRGQMYAPRFIEPPRNMSDPPPPPTYVLRRPVPENGDT